MTCLRFGSQLPLMFRARRRRIDLHKTESRIEWSVPWHVAVSGQRETTEVLRSGIIRCGRDQCGTDPSPLMGPGDRDFRNVKLLIQWIGGQEADRFVRIV